MIRAANPLPLPRMDDPSGVKRLGALAILQCRL